MIMKIITLKKKRTVIENYDRQTQTLFEDKLVKSANNKDKLIVLMNELDTEKRSLKSRLTQLSSEPDGDYARGRKRQTNIRKIKDKIGFLTEEREKVRQKLGSVKTSNKALNKITNSVKPSFQAAFMVVAEQILDEELFLSIEAKAAELIQSN